VYENRVLRRIFGAEWKKGTRGWRKLCDEDIYHLYTSTNIISVNNPRIRRSVEHVACMAETRNACCLLIGKHERKVPLRRPYRIWNDNIKINFKEAW
jgi:hypothetical protein